MTLLTTRQAAAALGMHPGPVRKLIEKGQLTATKLGRDLLIEPAEVERYQAARQPRGNPLTRDPEWQRTKAKRKPLLKGVK